MNRSSEVYRIEGVPVFQNRVFDSPEEARACACGDVILVQDGRTGLVFNEAFRPELLQYDSHYQNEQAHSAVFRAHLDQVAEIIRRHFDGRSLIEVGCGKGFFLDRLLKDGFEITGLDPTYEGDNPRILKRRFETGVGVRAGGLVLRHVLEHVQDPARFLESLRDANAGQGRIYIEVPCLQWICDHRAWFDIFYEHVNYFRLDDFRRIFGAVIDCGHLFGGQYLYVVAELDSLRDARASGADRVAFAPDFLAELGRHAARRAASRPGSPCALWGGASKGVIFALLMQRAGAPVDFAIDINPAKQDHYLPVTGIEVLSPERAIATLPAGSDVFVMNGNYLAEIRAMSADRFNTIAVDRAAGL